MYEPFTQKKFIDLIESMLDALMQNTDPEMEQLLKPLRAYMMNIEDFQSQKVVEARFRAFIKTRDEYLVSKENDPGYQPDNYEIEKSQKAINKILDQVLDLLERGLHASDNISVDVREVMQKVYEAKTINNIRALSEAFLDLGEQMMSKNRDFHSGISNLAVELSFCRNQIRDLEDQLVASKKDSDYDPLTGLRNRRVFEQDLQAGIMRARRFKNDLCLLVVDIDHFRKINEAWGNNVGDDVLLNFGKLLQRSLREFDLTYRLGGDEFAVIFNSCSLEVANKVANRVKDFIASHVYHCQNADFSMTISAGLAVLIDDDKDAQSYFERVDSLMLQARNQGGNRVIEGH